MKKYLVFIFILSLSAMAQEKIYYKDYFNQEMLKEVYANHYESEYLNNIHRKKSVNKLIERIQFVQTPKEKDEKIVWLSSVPLFNKFNKSLKRDSSFDINTFNIFKYNLDFFTSGTVVYRIDGTDWKIVINSQN
ncbi:hypothetical protein SY27_00545 [Flavobacterium sp. 316]|uniref:hypothetical protein n=1 Tax=Flavobacterium sp. 316 TaxID=1603293 RepID=UPI0005EA2311|nr:hypothetical protein [Flavobacterium sp. 316]KIX22382.1 hypothetical protein SY27_00545 [Flavobacterium sp. 316]